MPNTAEQVMSVSEFLAWERDQPERYEYSGGVITMMTGASLARVTITMNIAFTLRQSLRGSSGCRPFTNNAKVLAGNAVRYPDITVTCSPVTGKDDIVPDPVVVIEVVSPSTDREDRGPKSSITSPPRRSGNTPSSSRTRAASTFTHGPRQNGPMR